MTIRRVVKFRLREITRSERLFNGVGDNMHGLELVQTVATPHVTHLKFSR